MERKRRVLSCLDRLKEALPKFSIAMQNYVKHPSNVTAKVSHSQTALPPFPGHYSPIPRPP